jgi:hypothetical protein
LVRGRALDLAPLFDSEELEREDLASESESEESESESESDSESDEEDVDEELEAKVSAKANYEKWRPPSALFRFFFLFFQFCFSSCLSLFLALLFFGLKDLIRHARPVFGAYTQLPHKAVLNHTHFLNSSGTSAPGLPSALSFAISFGFSICCVLDGRETYGLSNLHSKIKCPALVQYVCHSTHKSLTHTRPQAFLTDSGGRCAWLVC